MPSSKSASATGSGLSGKSRSSGSCWAAGCALVGDQNSLPSAIRATVSGTSDNDEGSNVANTPTASSKGGSEYGAGAGTAAWGITGVGVPSEASCKAMSSLRGSASRTRAYQRRAVPFSPFKRAMSPRCLRAMRFSGSSVSACSKTERASSRPLASNNVWPNTIKPLMWPGCFGRCSRQIAMACAKSPALRYSLARGAKYRRGFSSYLSRSSSMRSALLILSVPQVKIPWGRRTGMACRSAPS